MQAGHASPRPTQSHNSDRHFLRQIAKQTANAIKKGIVVEPIPYQNRNINHSIAMDLDYTRKNTTFYPDDSMELSLWRLPRLAPGQRPSTQPKLSVLQLSINEGVQHLHAALAHQQPNEPLLGILNFASAKKPGGGFNGANTQQASIARSSSLYDSLSGHTARPFYDLHKSDDKDGFYTHAMIYSPTVVFFRRDNGAWMKPIRVEVVSSSAVNTWRVRKNHQELCKIRQHLKVGTEGGSMNGEERDGEQAATIEAGISNAFAELPSRSSGVETMDGRDDYSVTTLEAGIRESMTDSQLTIIAEDDDRDWSERDHIGAAPPEARIREVMTERMGRILALFELHGVRNLVLGSFGTGVLQNDISLVAGIWKKLLVGRQARFSGSFDRVLFAIPDDSTLDEFKYAIGQVQGFQ